MLLKSTTRHIRIFAAEVQGLKFVPSADTLTLDIDPDNELVWDDAALETVRAKFAELVADYKGEELSEYNLRTIGSDLQHLVRSMLFDGQLRYNLDNRVSNYSLGLPRVEEAPNPLKR
ncbi:MAG: NAD(P)H-quinone oxidoreductase subunit M [Geitlerinemataceae cyanobacterium]